MGPNDWQTYHRLVGNHLRRRMTVLELGCGLGRVQAFPWDSSPPVTLWGADVDPTAAANPILDRFFALEDGRPWPMPAEQAHLVLARYVLEHVADPRAFLAGVRRALVPGGRFLFLTPNARHPAAVASRLLPLGVKRRILAKAGHADPEDVFPTFYRMNTPGRLRALAAQQGLRVIEQTTREFEPCRYLNFCALDRAVARVYRSGVIIGGLERWLGAQTIGCWEKPAPAERSAHTSCAAPSK